MSASQGQKEKWNQRHSQAEGFGNPALVLTENMHLLPTQGKALDLACGLGANTLCLAEDTILDVHAWDISDVAIARLKEEAGARDLSIHAEVKDVTQQVIAPSSFDMILVCHFLERSMVPVLMDALRPRGLIFYQTFTRDAVSGSGPSNPAMRLRDNELLELFRPLRTRVYREEQRLGNIHQGWRDLVMLVAEKV